MSRKGATSQFNLRKNADDPFDISSSVECNASALQTRKPPMHVNHRAHSESRAGRRLEIHHDSRGHNRQAASRDRSMQHYHHTQDAGKGGIREGFRERSNQHFTSRGPRREMQGRGHETQHFTGSAKLSDRPWTQYSKTEKKGSHQLGHYQMKPSNFTWKTQSMQNLSGLHKGIRSTDRSNPSKREKKFDSSTIAELSKLESAEITMELAAPGNGLEEFLNKDTMAFPVVEGFLKILIKAIEYEATQKNLMLILLQIQGSVFLKKVLPFHILEYSKTMMEQNKTFFENTVCLITELSSHFPSKSFAEVSILVTLLEKAFTEQEINGVIICADVKKKLKDLRTYVQHLQQKQLEGILKSDNFSCNMENPTEDFRQLSIFPTHEDIYLSQNPLIRPNIVDGSYANAKSYLDTHYRLLREDFVRPLRDGILQLVTLNNEDLIKAKFDDINVYLNTHISTPMCIKKGIVHEVKFNKEHFKHVTWETSRRLLYGSLVCLSQDNFNTMLFATVADRDVDDLNKGIIVLMFTDESRQKLAEYSLDDTFLMVEATVYFVAYRHVLEGLREMAEDEIPFQNYIVHCHTTLSPPSYLSRKGEDYTLKQLINPGKGKLQDTSQKKYRGYLLNSRLENMFPRSKFNVLNFNAWPNKEELQLDVSQFKAFQMALTSELSLIQGPPGTGKTHVGLKIVQALLINSQLWKQRNDPILIVCYTNHALDQFLEGIDKCLECNIVRVGSRSSSEILQKCSLSNLRKQHYTRSMDSELYIEMDIVKGSLMKNAGLLRIATQGILHGDILEQYMPAHHLQSLMARKEYLDPESTFSQTIVEWLGTASENKIPSTLDDVNEDSRHVEATDDLIKIPVEAETAEAERKVEEDDDIRQQIKIARHLAEQLKQKNLIYFPKEGDQVNTAYNAEQKDHGGWQISAEMKKKMQKKIKSELEKPCRMTEEECEQISDLWQLPIHMRWEVYRCWRSKYISAIQKRIFILEAQYQIVVEKMTLQRNEMDQEILEKADIIGMTTTGAAQFRKLLQNIQPKIVMVEEAAEVLEAHIITTLSSGCQHLIMIGDHQQLRPSTAVYELARKFNLEVSMFERLIRKKVPYVRLDYQHRMRPEIARLLTPHIYDQLENHMSVLNFDNIKGVCHNLFFVNHSYLEEHIKDGKSRQNIHEAAFVKSLCLYFILQGYEPSQITILTTYSGQLHCLQKMMPKSHFEGVRVCVVDKYQGEENDIIILSLVRSNLEGNVGFLKIPNRVCVALSRAKKGLFCIGNMQILSSVPLWSAINDVLKANGQIGEHLKLQCVNHPNTITEVAKSGDFDSVPEGGCLIPCEHRLDCGHVCTLLCHPYDQEHKVFKCKKPCLRVLCKNNHVCEKICSDVCGKCKKLVKKMIPKCRHTQDVPCYMPAEDFTCKVPCTKNLQCGHQCVRTCGQECTINCPEKVKVTLECGHTVTTLCHLKIESESKGTKLNCLVKCEEVLSCGHKCPGNCSSCLGGSHLKCTDQCNTVLFCGHRCEEKCLSDCFCIRACSKNCFHDKCRNKCSEPCTPCIKQCGWKCKHKSCTKLCWESCDREACNKPCKKTLKCGHPCIGFCGEPCPKKCRLCDSSEVQDLFFGTEADPDARFVQLMDCPHFFEVTKFSEWMAQPEADKVIKLKACPKCFTPIKQNLRYGSQIKQTLSDLEVVRERISYKWMNSLEIYLSENEAELRNFSDVYETVEKLQDDNLTLRSVMLACEKIQYWQKLGAIQNKLKEIPKFAPSVIRSITKISNIVNEAKSKYDIMERNYYLLSLALQVELLFIKGRDLHVSLIRDLISIITPTISLEIVQAKAKMIPIKLDLFTSTGERKGLLDPNLLRQDLWHKCDAGHIHTTNKDEKSQHSCPQCRFGDDEE
ncbi:NFX1-type zinc finger-containing protein 1-like [Hyperolius riggenbachi]|uniref:NFX1-type zinc finger-containing protein 1-like n=1 Tax=Hyperolius riggenbachi TaxID=752182 RepID=UPI0035A286F1